MFKSFYQIIFISLFGLSLLSCNDEDIKRVDLAYNHGVFIVNEGNFTDSDGSLSFYDKDSLTLRNKVFESVNGRPFAGLMQSFHIAGEWIFIVDQNGRIEVLERETLESIHIIEEPLIIPRYVAVSQGKLFVSDWGPYDENYESPASNIKIFDLDGFDLLDQVSTGSRPEGLLIIADELFVANSAIDEISIYHLDDHSLTKTIKTNNGPTQFITDYEGLVWVVSTGGYVSGGMLQKINPVSKELIKTIDLSSQAPNGRICIDGAAKTIYFIGEVWAADYSFTETSVYTMNVSGSGDISRIISGKNFYGLGFDTEEQVLYLSNNEAFRGNGFIYRYQSDGTFMEELKVGRGPRDFVFVNP